MGVEYVPGRGTEKGRNQGDRNGTGTELGEGRREVGGRVATEDERTTGGVRDLWGVGDTKDGRSETLPFGRGGGWGRGPRSIDVGFWGWSPSRVSRVLGRDTRPSPTRSKGKMTEWYWNSFSEGETPQ